MATTRLMPLHAGMGRTVAAALERTTNYVENPDKTNSGEFISAYECNPSIADQEFLFSKRQYETITGRRQGSNDVIAYHLRQSFKPGEIDPERANKIGYDLAMSLTKGKHAFIVCTHVDKAHVHSHIIFNSTSLDCTRKFGLVLRHTPPVGYPLRRKWAFHHRESEAEQRQLWHMAGG